MICLYALFVLCLSMAISVLVILVIAIVDNL